jgi:GT2 family glycosyltransferase
MPAIYILLPVHNRKEITRGFVKCLKGQTFSDYHLVLIDDGSTDGTADMVLESILGTTVLRGKGNWWWAGSLQRGLNWLKENLKNENALILFINDDVHFPPDYLERAIHIMTDKTGIFMLSRYKSPDTGNVTESGVTANLKKLTFKEADSAEEINCLSTRGLFVHWSDVKVNGDFHPRLLPHYLSDYEYTMRAHRRGFKCETSSELTIEENSDTTGFHVIQEGNFKKFLIKYFSIKSPTNPIYFSSFVLLTCSPFWSVVNLMRIWLGAVKNRASALITTSKSCRRQ